MLRLLLLTCVYLFGLVSAPAFALDPGKSFQHYVRNAWSIQNGLPQITVQAIVQDRQGYIWVATQSGVARFDGVRFTAFTPVTEPALPGGWTRSLLIDSQGRLWIGTYKGLAVYSEGRFRNIPVLDKVKYPVLDVFAIVQDNDRIVTATSGGVFEVRKGKLVHREGSPAAQALLLRPDGLWVAGVGGVTRMGASGSKFMPLPAEVRNAVVTRLAEAQGRIWAGTSQGLYVRVGEQWLPATDYPAMRVSPTTMLFEDHDHNLWVGSNAGLARWREGVLAEFVPASSPAAFKGVIAAFEDREQNLWLGSQWEGLARLWNGWTRRYSTVEGINDPVVWSLSRAPDGRTWVGTNDGLSVLDHGVFQQVVRGDQLPHPHAYNLLAEADRVWIGTRRGLVLWRDGKVESPELFAPMGSAQINGIVRDSHGVVWIPTSDGLFRLADDKLTRYGQAEGLHDERVRQVRELADGRLLIGTQDGLFELRGNRLQQLGLDSGLHPDMDVTSLFQLHTGELVIGTFSEELYMFDGRRWQVFGAAQGVPANTPFFITEDDRGFLWAAGIRGIARVPLAEMRSLQRGKISRVHGEMVLNERGDRLSGQQGYCCNGAGTSKGFIDRGVLWMPSRDGVVT
ncbi:MAG: two-component regulator propeller domain-containing protein, partial [Arenimonas sp.]